MTPSELFKRLEEIVEVHSDFPLQLTAQDREAVLVLVRKYGAELLLAVFEDYQTNKPGKPFRYFLEDFGEWRKKHQDRHLDPAEYFARQGIAYRPPEPAPPLEELLRVRREVAIPGMRTIQKHLAQLHRKQKAEQIDTTPSQVEARK